MARILILSANTVREPYPVYPLGAQLVADDARARGHQVTLRDALVEGPEADPARWIAEDRPEVIGLSLRNIDNVDSAETHDFTGAYARLADRLRRAARVPLVLGGAAVSLFPRPLLEACAADYAITGPGEGRFAELAARLAAGERPADRVLTGTGRAAAPAPRDPDLARYYLNEGGMLNLQTKRGCPHRCAYCSYPLLEGRRYRHRPADEVADEAEKLARDHGADYLAFTDSVFNDTEGRYLEVAEALARRELGLRWMAFLRPQRFSPEDVRLLRRAGLAAVEWGSDAASDSALAGLDKGFGWAEVEAAHRTFADAGIPQAHFLVFGGPDETEASVEEGLANLERLRGGVVFAYRGLRILPATPLERRARDEGLLAPGAPLFSPPRFYFSPALDPDRLDRRLRQAFDPRPDRLYPPTVDPDRLRALHRLGHRGPLWDLLAKPAEA